MATNLETEVWKTGGGVLQKLFPPGPIRPPIYNGGLEDANHPGERKLDSEVSSRKRTPWKNFITPRYDEISFIPCITYITMIRLRRGFSRPVRRKMAKKGAL